ncbi:hypothetical protein [Pseudomonas protegens]|nr:hypothetical protein [Pseudomonas protegens]
MSTLFLAMMQPEEHNNPNALQASPVLIVSGPAQPIHYGRNTVFFETGKFKADRVSLPGSKTEWNDMSFKPLNYDFAFFSKQQRALADSARDTLLQHLPVASAKQLPDLFPLVLAIAEAGTINVYQFADMGPWGVVYVNYHSESCTTPTPEVIVQAIKNGHEALKIARRSSNDSCNYGRWRPDLEVERKFTFDGIPDTWKLINKLYENIIGGDLPGFVPEFNLDFQVYDYEAKIFEVLEPEDQAGYIAFIPQSNGKVCVKQKWFKENAEVRKETLRFNESITSQDEEEYANQLCGGKVKRLPAYRRTRFDVNFESLETGNVYGIFFDICRSVDAPETLAFSQCEVEYCRSRTWGPLQNIFEEYEVACAYAERFLTEQGVNYVQDLYSKLDFVRSLDKSISKDKEVAHV